MQILYQSFLRVPKEYQLVTSKRQKNGIRIIDAPTESFPEVTSVKLNLIVDKQKSQAALVKEILKIRNIPYPDGKVLYDLDFTNKYKNALEIGTFTGLSAIRMAWVLAKGRQAHHNRN